MKITGRLFVTCLLSVAYCCCNNGNVKENTETKTGKKEDSINQIKQQIAVNPYDPIDLSPMDISYYPVDYPKLKMTKAINEPPVARIIYSRPHLQGRQLFQDLLKYGEHWRLGANESTELQLYRDVTIQNKKIIAGRYVLYCIPQASDWTIKLNTNIDSWGLQPDSTKDIASFNVPANRTNLHLEYFTIVFEKIDSGAELVMAWDDVEARLPVNF